MGLTQAELFAITLKIPTYFKFLSRLKIPKTLSVFPKECKHSFHVGDSEITRYIQVSC